MTKKLLAILALTSLIFTACATATNSENTKQNVNPDPAAQIEAQENRNEAVQYLPYSEELYNELLGSSSFVLFFHQKDCHTCDQTEEEIINEMETFPLGTKILKVDYEKETSLKKSYGITTSSSAVIVNQQGEASKTLTKATTADIIAALKELQ